jgi:hypothetical protein
MRGASHEVDTLPVGLCAICKHVRRVQSARGSIFYLCRRSETDQRFPKYPPLPVRTCIGFEHREGESKEG